VVSKATGKVYARKRIRRKTMFGHDTHAQKIYENELHALKTIGDNDHLIKVRGTYTDKKYLVMLLEPVADGNLKQFMESARGLSYERQTQFRTYFGCLAHTIAFLHNLEVLHKDVKPENILLKDWRLILTDFGTAFDWSKTGQSMTRSNASDGRTPRYQSPEVANSNEFHRASDIWSLGVVFLEMVTIHRGQTLADMNEFFHNHGTRHTAVHVNLEAAIMWFEKLQTTEGGSSLDNEPLTWIKEMLNLVQFKRPSASDLSDKIVSFDDSIFCGRCCLGEDSESDSDMDTSIYNNSCSAIREFPRSDLGVRAVTNVQNAQRGMPLQQLPGSFPSEELDQDQNNELASTNVPLGRVTPTNELVMSPTVQETQSRRVLDFDFGDPSTRRRLSKTHTSGVSSGAALLVRKEPS
jgi:serine/threonine protein kinase